MVENKGGSDIEIPVGKYFSSMKKNPWIIVSIVLVVLIVILFYSNGSVSGQVSSSEAGQRLLSFVNSQSQGNGSVTLVSIAKEGMLYKAIVNYGGQSIPLYVSLDGKYLIDQAIPMNSTSTGAGQGQQQPSQNISNKTDRPEVDLFVMSYCPYGTQIEKGILPVLAVIGSKVDFKVRWVSYSMHGKKEIDENVVQYCIEKNENSKYLDYLKCFLGDGNTTRCQTVAGIDQTKLQSCIVQTNSTYNIDKNWNDKSTWLSGQYPLFDIDKADNEKYGVQGSPTLIINGIEVQSGRSPAELLSVICSAFTNAPAECSNSNLTSDAPNPGIGYSGSSAGDSAAAGCGV